MSPEERLIRAEARARDLNLPLAARLAAREHVRFLRALIAVKEAQ